MTGYQPATPYSDTIIPAVMSEVLYDYHARTYRLGFA
jgi:hypothetical protein